MEEQDHARDLAQLGFLQSYMEQLDFKTQIINHSQQVPLSSLLVGVTPDYKGRERIINFMYLPTTEEQLEHIRLLQLYTVLPFTFEPQLKRDLEALINAINQNTPLGHFGIKESEIYFRYMYAAPAYDLIKKEHIVETAMMVTMTLEGFTKLIEEVASGKKFLDAALLELRILTSN